MTVSNTDNSITYQGNGATTNFPFAFLIPEVLDCEVILYDSVTFAETSLSVGIDCTVAGIGSAIGGSVTYNPLGVPIPATKFLTVRRTVALQQGLSIDRQSNYDPALLEDQLDLIVMMIQQINTKADEGLVLPPGSTITANDLIVAAAAAQAAAVAAAASAALAATFNPALYATLAGAAFTGSVSVTGGAGLTVSGTNGQFILNKTGASNTNAILGEKSGALRWRLTLGNTTAEAGSDAGSDFEINRYTDASVQLTPIAFAIERKTGIITLGIGQLAFPATQNPSSDANTLDDYEEGTFTPTIVGVTTAGAGTYTVQVGRYTKIGRVVVAEITLVWTAHTGTGNMQLAGCPFTPFTYGLGGGTLGMPAAVLANNLTFGAGTLVLATSGTVTTNLSFLLQATGAGSAPVAIDTAAQVNAQITYQV